MREVALGLLLLFGGMFLIWMAVLQIRYREAAGETPFDLIGAIIPPLRRPMLWASTAFLGLLGLVALIGAAVHFMVALGVG